MTTDEKIRYLAELAGWERTILGWVKSPGRIYMESIPDYPHSLDAIARDLLPLLREKGWSYSLYWTGRDHAFVVWNSENLQLARQYDPEPARAAFEAIFDALHGGEE